ncbi:acylphosphatase [Candidatus Woesearchaeota archaeon]|nr:acylphosphatase [Candidatus Woesearchaeota archaeon]
MKYKKIIIEGKVQGIGFREFIRKEASKIGGVAGYVKNMKNGNVEVVVSGIPEKVNLLSKACKKGPFLADIKKVSEEEVEIDEEYDAFFVKF